MPRKKKSEEKVENTEEVVKEEVGLSDAAAAQIMPIMINMADMMGGASDPPKRVVSLYGDVGEKKAEEVVMSLTVLKASAAAEELKDPEDPESEVVIVKKPVELYLSTYGGSALDMFAIYDAVRMCQADGVEVHTYGLGKIMSAGVLLLACGTKGQRRIGKHCRVMLHGVISGQSGHIHDIENEMEETKFTQQQYHKALAHETNMTQTYLKKLVARKTNVYFTAQEAVELGIADIII